MRHLLIVALIGLVLLAACGEVAEPRPTFAPTHTALPRAANIVEEEADTSGADAEEESEVAEAEPTEVPPTPTPEPTSTPLPTATPEPTNVPTEEPTEAPTAEPTEAAAEESGGVVVNGVLGDADSGSFWFNEDPAVSGVQVNYQSTDWTCKTCHNVDEPLPGSGPYLYGIADHAGDRVPGMDAVEYLYTSIVDPGAHIAPSQTAPDGTEYEWEDGKMPNNWTTVLDDQQIADIVAYLLTLHEDE